MGDRRKVAQINAIRTKRELILQRDLSVRYSRLALAIARQFLEFGIEGAISAINMSEDPLNEGLAERGTQTAVAIGSRQFDLIFSRKSDDRNIVYKQFEDDFRNALTFFIASRALQTTTLVTQTDRTLAASIISAGVAEGLTNRLIANNLRENFTSIKTAFRATRIARTETAIVSSEAQDRAARESGVDLLKEWVAILDERTRGRAKPGQPFSIFNHTASNGGPDGQKVEMDALFTVGIDRMKGPHDLTASAGNIINCRCLLDYTSRPR